jgi:hypothetical protein
MRFLRGAQLVLRSSVFTVLDFVEMNVMLEKVGIVGSVLSAKGESIGDGWQCCRSVPSLPQLPPATLRNPKKSFGCTLYAIHLFVSSGIRS